MRFHDLCAKMQRGIREMAVDDCKVDIREFALRVILTEADQICEHLPQVLQRKCRTWDVGFLHNDLPTGVIH